jgi:hypothetical protein
VGELERKGGEKVGADRLGKGCRMAVFFGVRSGSEAPGGIHHRFVGSSMIDSTSNPPFLLYSRVTMQVSSTEVCARIQMPGLSSQRIILTGMTESSGLKTSCTD